MEYVFAFATDMGIKKKVNQDSLLVKKAICNQGNILLAVICDGMGGLSEGEVASATLIHAFSQWFEKELPLYLNNKHFQINHIQKYVERLLKKKNQLLLQYGKDNGMNIGTTVTGILIVNHDYFIFHIGDSRIYKINETISQLTLDHTWIRQEIERKHITEKQAKTHPRKNVLLQCIGAIQNIHPDFIYGTLHNNDGFLLCSDGFRHEITHEEIYQSIVHATTQEMIEKELLLLIELNKLRKEVDNITALYILCKEPKLYG